ncbi:MAG: hypothetical protein JSW27_17855, partial [Phycisphaerales bacterium]
MNTTDTCGEQVNCSDFIVNHRRILGTLVVIVVMVISASDLVAQTNQDGFILKVLNLGSIGGLPRTANTGIPYPSGV